MPSKKRENYLENEKAAKALDLKVRFVSRGSALEVFHRRDDEILLAGPAGTGKSRALLEKLHLAMSKYPGAQGLMSRKTRHSMTASCIRMFERHVLKPMDKVRKLGGQNATEFRYPNGSSIDIAGFDDPQKIMSTDYDMVYVQEATELTLNDWEMLTTRLDRGGTGAMPYNQIIADCNPTKPTHWMKKRCDDGLTLMLPSHHEDNPVLYDARGKKWTQAGTKYRDRLAKLSGVRYSRLFKGLWVAAEGIVYPEWDEEVHMVSLSDLPQGWKEWPHYWSIDWGYVHPFVWCDFIENPSTHQIYRLKEIYCTGKLVEDLAKYILELTAKDTPPLAIICDHDAEDRAVFEKYTNMFTSPAYKPINTGVQALGSRLKKDWCREGPGIFYVRDALAFVDETLKDRGLPTCTEEEYDGYVWPPGHKDDLNQKKDEVPVDKNNHGMDNSRYQVAFHDDLAIDPQEFEDIAYMIDDDDMVRISPY